MIMNKNRLIGNLRVALAVLTLFRLARLLAIDDGPLWVFARLRGWTDLQRVREQDSVAAQMDDSDLLHSGLWASLDEGLRCPYCVGIWLAPVVALLYTRHGWLSDLILLVLGLAGGQALLQGVQRE